MGRPRWSLGIFLSVCRAKARHVFCAIILLALIFKEAKSNIIEAPYVRRKIGKQVKCVIFSIEIKSFKILGRPFNPERPNFLCFAVIVDEIGVSEDPYFFILIKLGWEVFFDIP